jgi:surface-anchored protein
MSTIFQLTVLSILLATSSLLLSSVGAHTHDPNQANELDGGTAYYLAEHGDFDIGFDEGQLNPRIHLHAGAVVDGNALDEDTGFTPDSLIVVATHKARILRPVDTLWDSTGADVNEPLWVLPQHEKQDVPAFGLATEDIEASVFADDLVTLKLRYLKGPGHLSLWTDDAFGRPLFLLSTRDQLLSTTLPVGLHAHCNWGFTRPGTYTVVFEVVGEFIAGDATRALAVCTFLVSDKPVPLKTLEGDVNRDGAVDDADLQIVEANLGLAVPVWPAPQDESTPGRDHNTPSPSQL